MTVQIHGKSYITVAERLVAAHEENEQISITTEVLFNDPKVVIKATVTTKKGTFTGISAANVSKSIEKESPYEVAESSAVGRALAFAGYETTEGIASAEEMRKIEPKVETKVTQFDNVTNYSTGEGTHAQRFIETAAGKAKSKAYYMFAAGAGYTGEQAHDMAVKNFKLASYTDITKEQLEKALDAMKKKQEANEIFDGGLPDAETL
jgi:hypothetical protein